MTIFSFIKILTLGIALIPVVTSFPHDRHRRQLWSEESTVIDDTYPMGAYGGHQGAAYGGVGGAILNQGAPYGGGVYGGQEYGYAQQQPAMGMGYGVANGYDDGAAFGWRRRRDTDAVKMMRYPRQIIDETTVVDEIVPGIGVGGIGMAGGVLPMGGIGMVGGLGGVGLGGLGGTVIQQTAVAQQPLLGSGGLGLVG